MASPFPLQAPVAGPGGPLNVVAYGWSPAKTPLMADAAAGTTACRVIAAHRGGITLLAPCGEVLAPVPGRYRRLPPAQRPSVGDWVSAWVDAGGRAAKIDLLLPRQSAFLRKVVGTASTAQVVAANVDVVFVCEALDTDVNVRRVERYLALVWESGAEPVVVLTKADHCADPAAAADAIAATAPEVGIVITSAATGHQRGLDALNHWVRPGHTVAFVGPSGVGKSTLVNHIAGAELQATGDVREGDRKGRHTTTVRQIVPTPGGGLVLDTPGMRELQLWDADEGLARTFDDIEALGAQCKFADCTHTNEPGCAVTEAVAAGELDADRVASWRKLGEELAATEARRAELAEREARKAGARPRPTAPAGSRRRSRRGT